jgi:hypothetical protein
MTMKRAGFAFLAALLCACSSAALADADPAMLKARQKFFGVENVDSNTGAVKKDKVIFSWATNTTFVTSIQGRVIMLDGFITRPELPTAPIDTRYSKALPQEFVDARPEAIFVGHGHSDHADNVAFIAKWTNAIIYASPETCDAMQTDVARMAADPNVVNGGAKIVPNAAPVNCVGVIPRGSFPGEYDVSTGRASARRVVTPLESMVCVLAFKAIHSGATPVDPSFTHSGYNDLADPRFSGRAIATPPPATTYPAMFPVGTSFTPPANPANAVPGQMNTTTSGSGGVAGTTTLYYQFILRGGYNFSFAWMNSIGPMKEGIGADPGLVSLTQYTDPATDPAALTLARNIGAGVYGLMDALPAPDILLMAGAGNNGPANQGRDIVLALQHIRPKVYFPIHMTSSVQIGSGLYHVQATKETAVAMGVPLSTLPDIRLLTDPADEFVPNVYSPGDVRWADTNKSARYAQMCN